MIEDFAAVKMWFLRGNHKKGYTPSSRKERLVYMKLWCEILGLNPDQLAKTDDYQSLKNVIAYFLKESIKVPLSTIRNHITALNGFWRANGQTLNKKDAYAGIRGKLYNELKMRRTENVGET